MTSFLDGIKNFADSFNFCKKAQPTAPKEPSEDLSIIESRNQVVLAGMQQLNASIGQKSDYDASNQRNIAEIRRESSGL